MEYNKAFIKEGALLNCNGHKIKNIVEETEKTENKVAYYVITHNPAESDSYHTRYMFFKLEQGVLLFCEVEGFNNYRITNKNLYARMDYPKVAVTFTEEGLGTLLKLIKKYNAYHAKVGGEVILNAMKTGNVNDLTVTDFLKIAKVFEYYFWLNPQGLMEISKEINQSKLYRIMN